MDEAIKIGEELFIQGKIEEAAAHFQLLLDKDPDNEQALNDLGVIYQHQGQDDKAVDCFSRALQKKPDYLDAGINLAGCHLAKKQWEEAASLLEPALQNDPENAVIINQLSRAYLESGRLDDAQRIQNGSAATRYTKKLIDVLWANVFYWETVEHLTLRERLEGVASGVLSAIDGAGSPHVHFRLSGENPESGAPLDLEWLADAFYYKQTESARIAQLRERNMVSGRILKVDSQDWKAFAQKLYKEVKSEGSCLGDYTHTKKILRWESQFSQYDIEACLAYFQQNIGPCDCHVMRGVEV